MSRLEQLEKEIKENRKEIAELKRKLCMREARYSHQLLERDELIEIHKKIEENKKKCPYYKGY